MLGLLALLFICRPQLKYLQNSSILGPSKKILLCMADTGDEFYIKAWPQLVGRTFREILMAFPQAVPLGIVAFSDEVILYPTDDYILEEGKKHILICNVRIFCTNHQPIIICN